MNNPAQIIYDRLDKTTYLTPLHAYACNHVLSTVSYTINDEVKEQLTKLLIELCVAVEAGALAYELSAKQKELLRELPANVVIEAQHAVEQLAFLVVDSGYLYFRRYWLLEQALGGYIIEKLHPRLGHASYLRLQQALVLQNLRQWQQQMEQTSGHEMSEELRQAGGCILQRDFLLLSGGPGSGKTYSLTWLLVLLNAVAKQQDKLVKVLLTAPTAKAVARMHESMASQQSKLVSLELSLYTLHKALGYRQDGRFTYGKQASWDYDVVVVDEMSMVDVHLFGELLAGLKEPSKLVLIGDPQQLPSVGSGAVLEELVGWYTTGKFTSEYAMLRESIVLLQGSKRSNSAILQLAKQFLAQDMAGVMATKQQAELGLGAVQFYPLKKVGAEEFYHWVATEYIKGRVKQERSLGPFLGREELTAPQKEQLEQLFRMYDKFIVISPVHDGVYGVKMINERVRMLIGGGGSFFHGMPIVLTVNQPALALSNGDRGVMVACEDTYYAVFKRADGDYDFYLPNHLLGYEVGYAITVHKSQGSEYQRVAIVLPDNAKQMLERRLVYTAITRAKEQVLIFAEEEELRHAIERESDPRASQLRKYLL